MRKKSAAPKLEVVRQPLKLDLGCGPNQRWKGEGFIGVDLLDFGQPIKADLTKRWPWDDSSVEEAHCSHFIEHLTAEQRIHFVNELYRVLIPGGKATIQVPHWSSARAYGDLTHQWPPVTEQWFYHLFRAWREQEAPHDNALYQCDFDITWGYVYNPAVSVRNQEFVQFATQHYREAIYDMIATFVSRKPKD